MYQTVSKERGFQSFMNEPFGRRQNQRIHRLTFTDRLRRHPIPDWEPILWGSLTWISLKANKFQIYGEPKQAAAWAIRTRASCLHCLPAARLSY